MNLTFGVSESMINILPNAKIGVVFSKVEVSETSDTLNSKIKSTILAYEESLSVEVESKLQIIAETRKAYKVCGKEPSRYRPSAESLLRRVRTGKGLYQINNVVDTINLLSMSSNYSIGGFDRSQIVGDAFLDIGDDKPYKAIGRGELNIEFMPGMRDDIGYFGTPTSDSQRTMVTENTKDLILVYYDFFGNDNLIKALDQASEHLDLYCNGKEISYVIR